MKNIEARFAVISFSIALLAGCLLALGFVAWAAVTAWAGTLLAAGAYGVVSRRLRRSAREAEALES